MRPLPATLGILGLLVSMPPSLAAQQRAPVSDIRRVDFANFIFAPSCSDSPVTTRAGKFERTGTDPLSFHVEAVVYGDLTGDEADEAVVLTSCNTGGSGVEDEAFVYTPERSGARLLATVEGGDRAAGGIHRVAVDDGLLVVERYGEDGGGLCCPDFVEMTRYRWTAGRLVEGDTSPRMLIVSDTVREPPQPVRFAAGAQSAAVTGTVQREALFRLDAQAGQTLVVRLLKGEDACDVFVGKDTREYLGRIGPLSDEWEGTLPQSGSYLLLVRNRMSTPAGFSLEVTLRAAAREKP